MIQRTVYVVDSPGDRVNVYTDLQQLIFALQDFPLCADRLFIGFMEEKEPFTPARLKTCLEEDRAYLWFKEDQDEDDIDPIEVSKHTVWFQS